MRRFNFMIDPELDELLELEARREGVSKGALLRRLVREHFDGQGPGNESLLALSEMAGSGWPPEHHDDVVYPR